MWIGLRLVVVKDAVLGELSLFPYPAIFVRAYEAPGYFDCLLFPLVLLAGVLRNNIKVMLCRVYNLAKLSCYETLYKCEFLFERFRTLIG